jgi:hypothetical protein
MRHAHRLAPWQRVILYATGALLVATGLVWFIVHYSIGAGAGELPHPAEAWLLRIHGLGAYAAMFVMGVVAAGHIPHGWRLAGRQRWAGQRGSGITLCAIATLLALTGYLLNYFAPEGIRAALGWAHAFIGLAMGALITSHRRRD